MEQRILGKTGRNVSIVGLGTWQLGADWGNVDPAQAQAILAASVEAGVTLFDTADVYGDGKSEQAIGKFLADNPGRTLIVFHQWRFLTEPHRTRLREKRRSYEKFFTRAVAAGVASGEFSADVDVKVAVLGLLGALNWTPEWYSPDGPATPDELAAKLADALLGGLRARS